MNQGRVSVGHPVDVASGALFTASTDFAMPGTAALRWRRFYSTSSTELTWLGRGWLVPYFMKLERATEGYNLTTEQGGTVSFAAPTGAIRLDGVLLNLSASMELRREPDRYSILHWHSDGHGIRFCFQTTDDERMPLTAIENLAGHRIRVEYDPKRRPARLVQELERRTVEVTYDQSDLISEVHFLANKGRKLLARYEYDSDRRLVAAWDALGHRKGYEYDRENRMIAETNPLGSRFVFEYDRLGRCIRTAGADGYMERQLQYRTMPRMTRVTDTRGAVTDYYLNPAGQVLQIVYPLGAVTTNVFDEHGRLVKVIQADLSKESYEYDERGDRSATVDACGAKTTVAHNDKHVPTSMVDRNGTAWKLDNK